MLSARKWLLLLPPSLQFDVTNDPFAQGFQDDQFHSSQGRRLWYVLFVSFSILLLVCSGLAGLGYFATQRLVGPRTNLRPPERTDDSFVTDAALFNDSLDSYATAQSPDAELQAFIEQTLDDSLNGIEVPLNHELFIEAVDRSKYNTRPLNLVDRVLMRRSLEEYVPVADSASEHYRVLQVRLGPSPEFATADIFYYSYDGQAVSNQWFLAKENGQWSVYDWQRLEYGYRTSDEYAISLRGSDRLSQGGNDAITLANEAQVQFDNGATEAAIQKMRRAERIPTLPDDRQSVLLSIAYVWMGFEMYDEALRVLESIPSPNDLWGVWPSVAVCHYSNGDYEAALASIEKAALQSPNHPNVHWLRTQINDALGNEDLAAETAILGLRLSPKDSLMTDYVTRFARPQDLPDLLDILIDSGDESKWRSFIQNADSAPAWTQAFARCIANGKNVPAGIPELIAGNRAWTDEEHDAAATNYIAAKKAAQQDYVRKMANSNLVSLRTERDQYQQLFAESDNLSALFVEMFDWMTMDELYADPQMLLDAIEADSSLPAEPALVGLKGWCSFELEEYAAARKDFDAALSSFETLAADETSSDAAVDDPMGEESFTDDYTSQEDSQSRINTVSYYIVQCLLEEARPVDALHRFPDDRTRHQQVGDFLLRSLNQQPVTVFINATKDEPSDLVQLLRHRLLADEAFASGDIATCDQHHLAALELSPDVYDQDEWYRVRRLISQRAKNLAWYRTWRPSPPIVYESDNFDVRSTHLDNFASEAARLFDAASLKACLDAMEQTPADDATVAAVLEHQATMLQQQGDLKSAADLLQSCLSKTDDDDDWTIQSRKRQLAYLMLESGEFDSALPYLKDIEDGVPASAVTALFRGDLASVQDALQQVDREVIATDWLSEPEHLDRLSQCTDLPGYDELVAEFPFSIRHGRDSSVGTLYFDAAKNIDREFLQRKATLADSSVRFEDIPINQDGNSSRQSFIAKGPTQTVLFEWSTDQFDTQYVSESLHAAFESPVTRLSVSVMDRQPNVTQRMFRLANSIADDAFAFEWDDDSVIWSGADLPSQLRWTDRLPVPKLPVDATLYVKTPESDDDSGDEAVNDTLDFDQWKQMLQDNGGKVDVVISVRQQLFPELVPAVLTEVQEDDYRLCITVTSDSLTDPLIQAGKNYYCHLYAIRPAK